MRMNDKQAKVSIVIPYSYGRQIFEECLRMIFAQKVDFKKSSKREVDQKSLAHYNMNHIFLNPRRGTRSPNRAVV